ncbi:MAG: hypothetical protein PHV42_00235 [Candidatus Pacebacteria bacterium]|nr:hypothetical protein [Candidatus Paceibacterota bacterium]
MNFYSFFILNVLAIAWPVAILEILIEKDKGWGAGHPKDKWYGKIIAQNNPVMKGLAKAIGVPYFFGYSLVMYWLIIPWILVAEYFILVKNVWLLVAIFIAICFIEDFSWFVFNWYFDSLTQLLKGPNGSIWWHQKWIRIYKNKYLPASYFSGFALVIIFLLIAGYK